MIFNKSDGTIVCSCRKFVRRGFLCRHVFCVFKNSCIEEIPHQYVLRRWTRDIIPADLRKRKRRSETSEFEKLTNEATSALDDCIMLVGNDPEKLVDLVQKMKKIKTDLEDSSSNVKPLTKTDIIEKLHGIEKPDVVEIQNPEVSRYKGCANDGRLQSIQQKEKAKKKKGIKPKTCGICGMTDHNRRSCGKKKAEAEAKKLAEEKAQAQDSEKNI